MDVLDLRNPLNFMHALNATSREWHLAYRRTSIFRDKVIGPPGDEPNKIYFVDEGLISAVDFAAEKADDQRISVGLIGVSGIINSEFFAPLAPNPLVYVVMEDLHGYEVDVQLARLICEVDPGSRWLFDRFNQTKLSEQFLRQSFIMRASVQQRVALHLLETAQAVRSQDNLSITHRVVAGMLRLRRPSVSQILGEFERDGIIAPGEHGTTRILDAHKLADLTDGTWGRIRDLWAAFHEAIEERVYGPEDAAAA